MLRVADVEGHERMRGGQRLQPVVPRQHRHAALLSLESLHERGARVIALDVTDPDIRAIVSRGGRPDLAGAALTFVGAPTLLIVGGDHREVLELNRR